MGRHGNRVAAAEVPRERSSLVGPRAFVWSRSNETCHHPGPPSRPFAALASGGKIEPRQPRGGFGVKRRSEVLHHPELCAAHSRHWLPGERSDLVGPKAFDVNEVTRPVTTRKGRREFAASSYLFVAALYDAPPSEPSRFALPSVSGFRLVPSDRPRASGHALSREPRDPGLPFRSKPEEFNDERPGRHKKTLRSSAREGPSERIFDLIKRCRYSVHDLSRVQLDRRAPRTPRFNMPFELGIAVAWSAQNPSRHTWFTCEEDQYRPLKSISDLNGTDFHIHNGTVEGVMRELCNAFVRNQKRPTVPLMMGVYRKLRRRLPLIQQTAGAASLFEARVFDDICIAVAKLSKR